MSCLDEWHEFCFNEAASLSANFLRCAMMDTEDGGAWTNRALNYAKIATPQYSHCASEFRDSFFQQ
jgi:hypothetical protein